MPNLVPPVTNAVEAIDYRNRIIAAVDDNLSLDPLMVLYLTDLTTAATIEAAQVSGLVYAAKALPSRCHD